MTDGQDAAFAKPTIYGPDEDRPSMIATYESGTDGLSKREYFAAMAMQGRMTTPECNHETYARTAAVSVEMADALIAALNKREVQS